MRGRGIWIFVALMFLAVPAFSELVFQDDFSDDPSGPGNPGTPPVGQSWTVIENPPSTEVKIDSQKIVISRGSTATTAPEARGDLTAADALAYTSGVFSSDFVLYKTYAGLSSAVMIVAPVNNGIRLVSIGFQDNGDVTYFNGASWVTTGLTYTVAAYNDVNITVNTLTHTATVSVNGNKTPGSTNFAFLNNQNTMNGLLFTPSKGGFAFVDNVNINASIPQIVFFDTFEYAVDEPGDANDTPVIGDSWTVTENHPTDVELSSLAYSGSKAALLARLGSDPFNTVLAANLLVADSNLIETNGAATITYALQKDFRNITTAYASLLVKNGTTSVLQVFFQDDGSITYYNGATVATGLTYSTSGAYQAVEIAINFEMGLFTVSVEGNTTEESRNILFWNASSRMTSIEHRPGKDSVYQIDDFMVTTEEATCADAIEAGFGVVSDLNKDCYVNMDDLAILAGEWLFCMEPDDPLCVVP